MPNYPWHSDTDTEMGKPHPFAKIENLGTTNKSDAEDEKNEVQSPFQQMLNNSM